MVVYGSVIVLKRGGGDGSRFPITAKTCTFGRDPSCDIRISLATVAQTHCKLEVNKSGQVILSDVSKINQTLLNGISVKKNAILNHNDIISVSDRNFRWECAPSNDDNTKSYILKQNFRLKSDSITPVGIVSPIRRDVAGNGSSLSKSARKTANKDDEVQGSASLLTPESSKVSRRASVPIYYGDPVLTPTFSISRHRRSKSDTNISSANSSFKKSPLKGRRTKSKNIQSPSAEEIKKRTTSKRSGSPTNKRLKMRKLEDENTIKIIAPSSPDHKKSAALRTIHGSKIAVEKIKEKKLMRVKNYRQKKKYMIQRSEKIKQAVLKLHKTQPLGKRSTLRQTSRLMTVNEVKKMSKGVSSPASEVKGELNSNVNLTNMFVSPIKTPNNQSISYPMKKLISSIERRKRDVAMKSPDFSGLSSIFNTSKSKSPSRSKVTSANKNISPLKSQSEGSSSDSPKTSLTRTSGRLRKSLVNSNRSSSALKSPQSEASSSDSPEKTRNSLKIQVARSSMRKSTISQADTPRKSISMTPMKKSVSPLKSNSSRKSSTLHATFPSHGESLQSESFSNSSVKTRRSSTLQANSASKSPTISLRLSESSFTDSPMKTRKSNNSQRSSRRNSSVDSEVFKTPPSIAKPKDSTIQQKRKSSVSPRKSLSNSAKADLRSGKTNHSPEVDATFSSKRASSRKSDNLDSSDSKSPKISASSFYSPTKSSKRVSSDFKLSLSETRYSLGSSILMKTPRSPSKLSPRKSLSYSTNEKHPTTSPLPKNTRSSKKSDSSTEPRRSRTRRSEMNIPKLSFSSSPPKRMANLSRRTRSISAENSSERRSSRNVSSTTSRSRSISVKGNTSPTKTRKSQSSSPEQIVRSPGKRNFSRASSKLNLRAIVNIGKRNVKSPAVPENAQKSPEHKRKSKTTEPGNEDSFQKAPLAKKVDHVKQKKMAAKLAVSIIQKSKRRSLTSINKRSSTNIRQRGGKKSIASPNLSGLKDLFVGNEDDGLQTSGSAKQRSPLKKVAESSPRRLRARTATPSYGLSSVRTRQKKLSTDTKFTPQTAASPRGRGKSSIKRKVILESLNTSKGDDNQEDDFSFPEDLKVQSPSKSPSPVKVQPNSQRRISKRGTKAITLKIDLSPIKETPRKRAKTSKLAAADQENVEENISNKEKAPKKKTKAKNESLMTSPTEVPKSRKRGNKVTEESSPVRESPRAAKRQKTKSDEPEIPTAKSTSRGRKVKNVDAQKSPDQIKEVKSVRASARLRNK